MNNNDKYTCPICNQDFIPADGTTTAEHLAKGVLKNYAEMQGKGKHENTLPCPRCGKYTMSDNILKNALSRQFDIHICDLCGNLEGIEAANGTPRPLESWWVVTEILK